MLCRLLIAAAALAVAGPALAGEAKEGKKEDGQYILLAPVALPIVGKGRLVNYVFVTVRVILTPSANAPKLREKEPYYRDALVRAGHRTPFTMPNDYNRVDEAKLKAQLYRDAVAIAGPGNIAFVQIDSQQPQHHQRVDDQPRPLRNLAQHAIKVPLGANHRPIMFDRLDIVEHRDRRLGDRLERLAGGIGQQVEVQSHRSPLTHPCGKAWGEALAEPRAWQQGRIAVPALRKGCHIFSTGDQHDGRGCG